MVYKREMLFITEHAIMGKRKRFFCQFYIVAKQG
jgi:hypothetical protein